MVQRCLKSHAQAFREQFLQAIEFSYIQHNDIRYKTSDHLKVNA